MLWPLWVVLIAGSTGSALRAVRPPNLHITPDARCDLVQAASAAGSYKRSPFAIIKPTLSLAILLASAMAATFVGRRVSKTGWSQGRCLGAMGFGVADHRQRAGREQAAQIAIAAFADTAKPILAAARVLLGDEPNPGREVPSRPESPRISDAGNQSGRQSRTDTGVCRRAAGSPHNGSVPSPDHTIELQDLQCLQRPQLGTESGNTRTGKFLGQPLIICIGSNPEQLLDTLASDRRDDPKLCKMSA